MVRLMWSQTKKPRLCLGFFVWVQVKLMSHFIHMNFSGALSYFDVFVLSGFWRIIKLWEKYYF